MRRLLATVAALTMLGMAGIASAADMSGKIAAVDQSTIVLENGTTLVIGEGVSIDGLQPGMNVMLSYEEQDGQRVVTGVKLM